MKTQRFIKVISLIFAITLALSSASIFAYAEDEAAEESQVTIEEAQQTLEQQRADLEQKLAENQAKLDSFEENAEATADYIDTLDEKIGYLNEELTLLDNEVAQAQASIDELLPEIDALKEELEVLNAEYEEGQEELVELEDSFQATYDQYCLRLRAMYISGSESIIAALLTSGDIAQFFDRYQMIKAVSKSDTELLSQVNAEMDEIVNKQDGLAEQKTLLNTKKQELDTKQLMYETQRQSIEDKQQEIANTKVILADDRARSDALLAQYSAETEMYTEYRNEDQELIDEVNQEIDNLLNGLVSPDQIGSFTESERTETAGSINYGDGSSLYSGSNAALSMTYPVPGHYAVSQNFGNYRNGKAHTGIDYPCPTGSSIVAAQKGIVVTVKRLNYSYGYYVVIYHGTDANGRKVATLYAHNSSILVSVGQTVTKGQQIAKSGSTGNSTGPHCHFELIIGGTKTNPKYYLS